uniref:Uncharacterized protein n=1 Tax=Cacopsylla melanoneura TaxID=428564 RepID=A0A8D8RXJ0_9HEMI
MIVWTPGRPPFYITIFLSIYFIPSIFAVPLFYIQGGSAKVLQCDISDGGDSDEDSVVLSSKIKVLYSLGPLSFARWTFDDMSTPNGNDQRPATTSRQNLEGQNVENPFVDPSS